MRTIEQVKKKIKVVERRLELLYKYRDHPDNVKSNYDEYTKEIEFYKGRLKSLEWVLDE